MDMLSSIVSTFVIGSITPFLINYLNNKKENKSEVSLNFPELEKPKSIVELITYKKISEYCKSGTQIISIPVSAVSKEELAYIIKNDLAVLKNDYLIFKCTTLKENYYKIIMNS